MRTKLANLRTLKAFVAKAPQSKSEMLRGRKLRTSDTLKNSIDSEHDVACQHNELTTRRPMSNVCRSSYICSKTNSKHGCAPVNSPKQQQQAAHSLQPRTNNMETFVEPVMEM